MVVVVDGLAASGGLYRRAWPPTTSSRRTPRWSARSACSSSIRISPMLLKTIGVKVEEIKSSPLKAAPNGFEPTSPEARAAIEAIVHRLLRLVQRPCSGPPALGRCAARQRVADGRVFTGRQAVGLKLIDELGNEKTALDWLGEEKDVAARSRCATVSLTPRFSDFPSCTSRRWTLRCGRLERACAAHRRMGRACGGRATQS